MSDQMNPALRAEIQSLQQSMAVAACSIQLPDRFDSEPHGNQVTITDRQTGLTVTVGLCDYHGARKVLATLFPDA